MKVLDTRNMKTFTKTRKGKFVVLTPVSDGSNGEDFQGVQHFEENFFTKMIDKGIFVECE